MTSSTMLPGRGCRSPRCAPALLVAALWIGVPACADCADLPHAENARERIGAPGAGVDSIRGLAAPLDAHDPVCALVSASGDGRVTGGALNGDSARAGFAVQFDDEVSPFRITSVFVMPGQVSEVRAVLTSGGERFEAGAAAGTLTRQDETSWSYRAPAEPGVYALLLCGVRSNASVLVNVFVLEPYDGQDVFHGYRIGRYERLPLRGDPVYAMPRGLVRVTRANENTWVSPHFQLKQFVCKQESDDPRFLALRTRLLTKLEMLIEALAEQGVPVQDMYVMSGYRTPWYNRAIGNASSYSRHAYGDAADVFIDNDRNAWMDDLTGDGRADVNDARVVSAALKRMTRDAWYAPFAGGLGLYDTRPPVRGPFVHIDTRGRRARW